MSDRPATTYDTAFPDLAQIYLEDSWVLGIDADDHALRFDIEVVLTEKHPAYTPPDASEHYCYRRAALSVTSDTRIDYEPSGAPPTRDASGETDLGNIDSFVHSDPGRGDAWRLRGDWGTASVLQPSVVLAFKN